MTPAVRHLTDTETAAEIAAALRAGFAESASITLTVSGGSTPRRYLPHLAGAELAWDRVTVTLADERWVPPDDRASNERGVRELLLTGPAAAARFIPSFAPDTTIEARARDHARIVASLMPPDVLLLGMGNDGHIASLFPGTKALWTEGPATLAFPAAGDRHARLSIAPGAALAARRVFLVFQGADKADALERHWAGTRDPDTAPVVLLRSLPSERLTIVSLTET